MPQGLQAWDENGNLIVDIGDYSTRFFATFSANFSASATTVSYPVPGCTVDKHFAAMVKGNGTVLSNVVSSPLVAIAGNNVVYVTSLNGPIGYAMPITVDVFAFS